jgi:hypothetical protein
MPRDYTRLVERLPFAASTEGIGIAMPLPLSMLLDKLR